MTPTGSYVAKLEQVLHIMELHQQPYTEQMKVDSLVKGTSLKGIMSHPVL